MNPNQPPHSSDIESQSPSGQGTYAPPQNNPYYAQAPSAPVPDLDAGAPLLTSSEAQRLNRKALFFLAGIVGLLALGAVWLFTGTTTDEAKEKPREEAVVIPELPAAPPSDAPAALPNEDAAQLADPIPVLPAPPPQAPSYEPSAAPQPTGPTLRERRMAGSSDETESTQQPADAYMQAMLASTNPEAARATPQPKDPATSARYLNHPDALLVRGTYIRCVLETRIVTDIPGFTSCVVTEPVYSINGRRLLLPKGSKVYGKYASDANGPRISVIWDRITTPTGVDVAMASPGTDQLGGAGHPGDYNAHWGSRMSAALMISLISDAFKYVGAKEGPTDTTVTNGAVVQTPFESNTARTMERLANQALERSANRPATVTINQGTVVSIYIAKDIDFSAVMPAS